MMLDLAAVEVAMVVTAHPDDVDFGAAGTVATLTDLGTSVTYCIATSGEAGGDDRSMARSDMAALREVEQRMAAKAVGVTDVCFLGHPDGNVVYSLDLRRDIARVVRQVRPQVVICQSPEMNLDRIYASHPDHRATGAATLDAVYPDARNPFAFPELIDEGLEPHSVEEVWVMAHAAPTRLVDITAVMERKIDALCCHESQVKDRDAIGKLLRDWAASIAETHGLTGGDYAEGFKVVDTR